MNSILKEHLFAIPSVTGLEPTYPIETSDKWLVVVEKSQKDHTRNDIDHIINDTIFLNSK